ncbi:MAG: peptidoglycan-associated lipoprotein [Bacteriovorax sp. MedPE-SWde]|nr:MAG: peptidoglycan-associated lipoprotein [Bacteriovorax sp. MedPE-SWde]
MKKLFTLLFIAGSLTLTSCGGDAKKTGSDSPTVSTDTTSSSALEINGDSDSSKAGSLQSVYFGFNSAVLTAATRTALETNAQFLKDNPSVEVQVEGHCDERGGVQFNIALGEKRARTVKRYLTTMGVSASRIQTISYGKERPIAFGHDDSAWSQNRRGNFVITAK